MPRPDFSSPLAQKPHPDLEKPEKNTPKYAFYPGGAPKG